MMLCAILLSALLAPAAPNDNAKVSDLVEHALQQSQLTLPGSRPVHLQATLVETTNPKSQYQAKIEEFWLSPTKWRHTIESPGTGGGPASEVPTDCLFCGLQSGDSVAFHPYVLNGKAQYFHATVTFPVK